MSRRRKVLRDLNRPTLRMEKTPMNPHAIDVVHAQPQHPQIIITCVPTGQPGQFNLECASPFDDKLTTLMLHNLAGHFVQKLIQQLAATGRKQIVLPDGPLPKIAG